MTDAKRGANSASVALAFLDAGFTLCQAYPVRGLDLAGHVLVPGLRTLARAKKIVQHAGLHGARQRAGNGVQH